jgi:hypothetical protein
MAQKIGSYAEFWPFYLAAHSRRATRAFHYVGTAMIFVVVAIAWWSQAWWTLIFTLPALYAFAWFSHFVIEGNRPATFTHPVWSLASDFRMAALALVGRLGREFEKYQIRLRA